jgi:hypothetical protein
MNALNRYRARRCDRALRSYDTSFDLTECLIDFLADARHWCDRHGHSYADLDRTANGHYCEEVAAARRGNP